MTLVPPVSVTVAELPPLPLMVPAMLQGQPEAAIAMLNACVALCIGLPESATWTVNVAVPLAVGVPVICPVADMTKPRGRVVLFINVQLTGGVPPVDDKLAEYATPGVPPGRLGVVINSVAGCTVSFVLFVTDPKVAVIVDVPPAMPDATPLLLTLATTVLEEDQVTRVVMFCVLLSLYVPVAVNGSELPT